MGWVVVVAVVGAAAAAAVVVVNGVCSPLVHGMVYGQRLFTGVVVVDVCSPLVLLWLVSWWWRLLALVRGQRLFAGMLVVGVCSPLVFVGLVGGRRFLCSLACGWLVVAFARLWCPCVCSLGRWLASVRFGSIAAAGLVVVGHVYALSGLGSRLGPILSLSFSVRRSICCFGGIHRRLPAKHGEMKKFVIQSLRLSCSGLKCVATLGLAGAGILVLSKWCFVLLKSPRAAGLLPLPIALGCWCAPVWGLYLAKEVGRGQTANLTLPSGLAWCSPWWPCIVPMVLPRVGLILPPGGCFWAAVEN